MDVEAGRPIRKFSVVIPARNAAHLIGDQLSALAAQTYSGPWEVIVADNGSTDRTATSVLEMADRLPDLRVVDASKRSGASHARNIGALEADGDYLLFVDADDQVRHTWLEEMACVAPQADAVGGDILSYFVRKDGTRVVEVATMDGLPTVFEFWPFAPAGNFGIRKDVFGEIGGFNEDYRVCEDVEISWRIHTSGHSLRFVPGAVLECRERSGWWTLARQSYAYARGYPHLYRDFRRLGMTRYSVPGTLKYSLRRYVVGAPRLLRTETGRREWVRGISWRAGCLAGSLKYRVPCI
jgi:glycosyltransferase involved in cell wall biosynthesis